MSKLPDFLRPYFWDVDFDKLDPEAKSVFVAQRVIDRGTTPALKWLLKQYSIEVVKQALLTSRDLTRKTANFWADVLSVDRSRVPCLQKPYSPIPFGVSS